MATHSSILAWRIPMERGVWWTTVHGVTELDMTERLSTAQFSSVQSLSHVRLCNPMNCSMLDLPVHHQLPESTKPMFIESVMPFNHLILCHLLLLHLQSFQASGSFQMSQFFASCGQRIEVSASTSILPMNTQD